MAKEAPAHSTPLFPKPPSGRTLVYAAMAGALGAAVFIVLRAPLFALALVGIAALALIHGMLMGRAYSNASAPERSYAWLARSAARRTLRAADIFAEENRTPSASPEAHPAPDETGLLALRTSRSAAGVAAQRGGVWKGVAVFCAIAAVYVLAIRLPIRPFVLISAILSAIVSAALFFEIVRGWLERRQEKKLLAFIANLDRDDLKELQHNLEVLSEGQFDRIAAPAHTALCFIAERGADFELALAHANLATIHHLRARFLGRNSLPLAHELLAQRAFLLAVLDKPSEARAEVAWLDRSNAPYTHGTHIRVEAVRALKAGNYDRSAELFDQFDPETPLSERERWLMRAAYRPARMDDLKDAAPDLKAWLKHILPR